jgi:hypothetical protein
MIHRLKFKSTKCEEIWWTYVGLINIFMGSPCQLFEDCSHTHYPWDENLGGSSLVNALCGSTDEVLGIIGTTQRYRSRWTVVPARWGPLSKWHPRRWRHTCMRRAKLSMTRTHSSYRISLIFAVIAAFSSPIVWGLFSYTLSLRYPHRTLWKDHP